jgi:hypothetical protein
MKFLCGSSVPPVVKGSKNVAVSVELNADS